MPKAIHEKTPNKQWIMDGSGYANIQKQGVCLHLGVLVMCPVS